MPLLSVRETALRLPRAAARQLFFQIAAPGQNQSIVLANVETWKRQQRAELNGFLRLQRLETPPH